MTPPLRHRTRTWVLANHAPRHTPGMRSYRGMSPLTTATVAVIDRLRVPVERMSEQQRHEARGDDLPDDAAALVGDRGRRPGGGHHLRDGAGARRLRDPAADLPPAGDPGRPGRRAGHRLVPRWRLGPRQRRQLRPAVHPPRGGGRRRRRERRLPAGARSTRRRRPPTTRWTRRRGSRPSPTCCARTRTGWRSPATPPAATSPPSSPRWCASGADWIRHQALLYPATDLTMASPSIDEHANAPILTRDSMLAFREHYAAGQD